MGLGLMGRGCLLAKGVEKGNRWRHEWVCMLMKCMGNAKYARGGFAEVSMCDRSWNDGVKGKLFLRSRICL